MDGSGDIHRIMTTVSNGQELADAVDTGADQISVQGEVTALGMLSLQPGQTLSGGTVKFGANGVRLSRDNTLTDIRIETAETERAILNDPTVDSLGTLELSGVQTVGQVQILAHDAITSGTVTVTDLHIERADLRGRTRRPHAYGVDAMQGAFTLWNMQTADTTLTAELLDISAGSQGHPIRGWGVFVGGQGTPDGKSTGGRVDVSQLSTGAIHTDGGIVTDTPDLIGGGVFVSYGGYVKRVTNEGPVTTYGPNDMALDNWGHVDEWVAEQAVTTHGPSAIGFVQFGELGTLRVNAPIKTYGNGARGFNLYDGSLDEAAFDSIETHADGAIGIQVSRQFPKLSVDGDVMTEGGEANSLVKGVVQPLKAVAMSIKERAMWMSYRSVGSC